MTVDDKPPQTPPVQPPSGAVDSPASASIAVASPAGVTISADLRKRFPADQLVANIIDTLQEQKVGARTLRAEPGYQVPGDDEFSFTEPDALAERIATGFPRLAEPLVIVTLAERGPNLIAAAHVFSPGGGEKFKRIVRDVVATADADVAHVQDIWPKCFADAIRLFKENPNSVHECEKLGFRGTTSDPGPAQAAPAQTAPPPAATAAPVAPVAPAPVQPAPVQPPAQAPPPGPTAAVTPKAQQGGGMLDDVPDSKTTVIIPNASKGAGMPKPSGGDATRPLPPTGSVQSGLLAQPEVITQSPRLPTVTVITSSPAAPPASATVPRSQLFEQILAYGFVWKPRESTNLVNAANMMAERTDEVGSCLGRGGMTHSEISAMLQRDAMKDHANIVRQTLEEGYFQVTPDLADRSITGSAAYCLDNVAKILPFHYRVYPPQQKITIAIVARALREAKQDDAKQGLDWRLPTAIEAYAIATLIIRDRSSTDMSFWMTQNGEMGIISVKNGESGPQVDHTWSAPQTAKATTMIAVHF